MTQPADPPPPAEPAPAPFPAPKRDLRPLACALLLALLAIGVFSPSFGGPFVFDDEEMIVRGRLTHHGPDPMEMLCGRRDPTEGYRPLLSWSLAVNWALGPNDPRGFHAVNLALHGLNAALLSFLLLRFIPDRRAAFAGALLFAIHPVHAEVASAIGQRACGLACAFYLAGWLAWLRGGRTGLGASLAFYFFGLLSWEGAATLPAALLLSDAALGRLPDRRAWGRTIAACALYALPLLLYFALRHHAAGTLGNPRPTYFAGKGRLVAWLTVARFFVEHYVPGLLLGVNLSPDYSPPSVPDAVTTEFLPWKCAVLLVLLAVLAARRLFTSGSRAGLGLLVAAVAFLPVSNLLLPFYGLGAQRYAYLPSLGVSLIAAAAAERLLLLRARWLQALAGACALAYLLVMANLSLRDAADWADPVRLYTRMSQETPRNPVPLHNLGSSLAARGKLDDAIAAYRSSLELAHDDPLGLHDLGWAYLRAGYPSEAEAAFRRTCEVGDATADAAHEPDLARHVAGAWTGLGVLERRRRRPEEAEVCLRKALRLRPDFGQAWSNLGLVLEAQRQLGEAEAAYRKGVDLEPLLPEPLQNLAAFLEKSDRLDEAAAVYRQAIARAPTFAEAHLSLGLLLMRRGAREEGAAVLRRFLVLAEGRPDLAPLAESVRRNLGPERSRGEQK
ncbi:MAG: tetratricopeptide repeat protein [Planctomycetes bacterium]|nr:tetratricopeptide repeat protein [Planctomycetota bacterium]